MTSTPGEGQKGNTDDSVPVLGKDGGAASVNATVLYRVDPTKATTLFRTLGTNYADLVRPAVGAQLHPQSSSRGYDMVAAATTDWNERRDRRVVVHEAASSSPRACVLQDFQLREVHAELRRWQRRSNAKVAAQQVEEQQEFELATAQQQADITRIQALATADSQQILACGGSAATLTRQRSGGADGDPEPAHAVLAGPAHARSTCSSPTSRR